MNQRQRDLLSMLMTAGDHLYVQDLASQLECSEKTVRNDMKEIENELQTLQIPASIIRKPGIGVYLEASNNARTKMMHVLLSKQGKTFEERTIEIAFELLTNSTPRSIQQLSEQYFVSKSIIRKDMAKIQSWLKNFDLVLISKPRLGNVVEGSEFNKRFALAHLYELFPSLQGQNNVVLDLFEPVEVTTIRKWLVSLNQEYEFYFSDDALESLVIHALIMLKRTRQKSVINIVEKSTNDVQSSKEYQLTKRLFKEIKTTFGISFPEEEYIYFTWHVMSAKKRHQSVKIFQEDEEVTLIVQQLIKQLKEQSKIDFHKDESLEEGLKIHMYSVLHRINYGLPISNPLLNEIKQKYAYIFNMVMLAVDTIGTKHSLEITEDEAAYLVLHFQASMERIKTKSNYHVVIVCHMGIGVSNLLQAKLEQHFSEISIIDCIGKNDLKLFLKENRVDLIISTIPLKNIRLPHIVISPLLEEEDKEKLKEFFAEVSFRQKKESLNHQMQQLLSEDHIYLQVDLEHRYEIVEFLARKLVEKNMVQEAYVHSAVNRERRSATLIGAGMSMPHGSPDLVNQSCVAVAQLKKPVDWGSEKISLVFMLAIHSKERNITKGLMHKITSISNNPLQYKALSGARDVEEFIKLFNR